MCEQCFGPANRDRDGAAPPPVTDHGNITLDDAATPGGLGRRGFLAAAAMGVLGGCATDTASRLPAPPWEVALARPERTVPRRAATDFGGPTVPIDPPATGGWAVLPGVRPRTQWGARPPVPTSLNPMARRITAITVHHDAEHFHGTSPAATVARLRKIQRYHIDDQGWADIGYHFAIDRRGEVWEARELRWQGAHAKPHNEGNVGVVLLGNFEVQTPSREQLLELSRFVRTLRGRLGVAEGRVYGHRELPMTATECPGRHLLSWMGRARTDRML